MEAILNWIKKNRKRLLIGAGVLLLLAAAFWYGSGSPDSKGFRVNDGKTVAEQPDTGGKNRKSDEKTGEVTEQAIGSGEKETASAIAAAQPENSEKEGKNLAPNTEKSGNNSQQENQSPDKSSIQSTTAAGGQNLSEQSAMVINPDTGKDPYQTDPVPEGKPEPVEPEPVEPEAAGYTCTISISCVAILNNMDALDKSKVGLIPADGWILKPVTVSFQEGESVFDVLQRACKEKKIHMEFSNTPMYNSAYIEGIHNIYEFDAGSLSGWMYRVNGWFPNYGCSRYQLKDGDAIEWMYTCNLGKDIGGNNAAGQ